MIISRTPLRISFVGGGSDLPSFYKKYSGSVVSTAIDKYIFITVNKKFDNKIRVSYSETEIVDRVTNLKHELVRECLKKVGIKGGIEITSIADIPSEGTGLGSSSSYTVGLLNALYAYVGKFVPADKLAKEASEIEIKKLKKPIGKQDHYIAAYGGLRFIQFNSNDSVYIDPLICTETYKKRFENNLLLFYTGITRSSYSILNRQNKKINKHKEIQETLKKMVDISYEMKKEIQRGGRLERIGKLLHQNWVLKKNIDNSISNPTINNWYSLALKNGALGGKILGAGGGGFLLIYAKNRFHPKIIETMTDAGLSLFKFKFEREGSKIIYIH